MGSKKRASSKGVEAPPAPKKREGLDGRLAGGIAVLVAGLAAIVWWALPDGKTPPEVVIETEASTVPEEIVDGDAGAIPTTPLPKVERPPRAVAALLILTARSDEDAQEAAGPEEVTKHLEARHCGAGCDLVKKSLQDEDFYSYELRDAEDVVLPPKDTLDTVAAGLTPAERDGIESRKHAVLIGVDGNIVPAQPAARALYAVAAELAEQLDGYVYDEVERRIFSKDEMLARTIQAPVGSPAFRPEHIAVQLFRQDDGTERMTTLGMERFGAPDLCIQGANMTEAPLLAAILNDAARVIAGGESDLPLTVMPAKPLKLEGFVAERDPTDPENDLLELRPTGGATREAWDQAVTSVFASSGDEAPPDDAIAKKMRASLPDAVKRFEHGDGFLFVKGPFPIPEDERLDGGEGTKQLWIQTASCSATLCTGIFTPEPTGVTNIAPGKTVSVNRNDAVDWMIRLRDGGAAGGETLRAKK